MTRELDFSLIYCGREPAISNTVVAIPANNEAAYIERCLAALAMQRDRAGRPLASTDFEIFIYANNCQDHTALLAEAFASRSRQRIRVLRGDVDPSKASAGFSRKHVMDSAAESLRSAEFVGGLILTTDADSCVGPTWVAETRTAIEGGVDCVAGYVDAQPFEITALGETFLHRARLEDEYLALTAEIHALCGPEAHNPWPNHRMTSGASLAVTLCAYEAVGGLPPLSLGEDVAFVNLLREGGFRIRHSLQVQVCTSCRFDGRARGGAADTMRLRFQDVDSPCDPEMERALPLALRLLAQRRSQEASSDAEKSKSCEAVRPLRPSDLPKQIHEAERILRRLRAARSACENSIQPPAQNTNPFGVQR
jgi:hypothetical protein